MPNEKQTCFSSVKSLFRWLFVFCFIVHSQRAELACGRVGGDTQPRPKPRLITSPDQPGLPQFFVVLRCRPGMRGYSNSLRSKVANDSP